MMTRIWLCRLVALLACLAPAIHAGSEEPADVYTDGKGLTVTVTAPYTNIHTGPGRGYPIFHVAAKHETLRLLKRRTNWYKVVTRDGNTGWVRSVELADSVATDGAALDFSAADWQDYRNRRWEVGMHGGDFSGARTMGLHLGYRMTTNLSTELKYTQAFGRFSDSKLAGANIVHKPFPAWRLTPFFTLGTGVITTSPSATLVETEDRQDNFFSVGGGLVFYLSQRFALRAEYDHHTILTTRESNEEVEEWKAGFSVSF